LAASGLPMSAGTLYELWRGTSERVDNGGAGIARFRELLDEYSGQPDGRMIYIRPPTDLRIGAREEAPLSAAFLLNNPQARPPPEPAGPPAPAAARAVFRAALVDAASEAGVTLLGPVADAGPPALVRP
jgi:hypothetical protein